MSPEYAINDEKHVEDAEIDGWNNEKIHGRNYITMVL